MPKPWRKVNWSATSFAYLGEGAHDGAQPQAQKRKKERPDTVNLAKEPMMVRSMNHKKPKYSELGEGAHDGAQHEPRKERKKRNAEAMTQSELVSRQLRITWRRSP